MGFQVPTYEMSTKGLYRQHDRIESSPTEYGSMVSDFFCPLTAPLVSLIAS